MKSIPVDINLSCSSSSIWIVLSTHLNCIPLILFGFQNFVCDLLMLDFMFRQSCFLRFFLGYNLSSGLICAVQDHEHMGAIVRFVGRLHFEFNSNWISCMDTKYRSLQRTYEWTKSYSYLFLFHSSSLLSISTATCSLAQLEVIRNVASCVGVILAWGALINCSYSCFKSHGKELYANTLIGKRWRIS